jgi:hypothetical protein
MAVTHLESLVLRGVTVGCDGQTVGLRLGTSYAGGRRAPEDSSSMRHPSPGCRQDFNRPADRPDRVAYGPVAEAAFGAGRSRSRAGVLSRRSPARIAGRTIPSRWSPAVGGPELTAAARLCPVQGQAVASVSEALPGRPSTANARALPGKGFTPVVQGGTKRGDAGLTGWKPASSTPVASTGGKGVR